MILAFCLFVIGLALSAFFSGSETGFYRVTRVRLLIDALSGDWIARGLLWITNHPSVFVATALVGNNLANYISSLSVVVATRIFFSEGNQTAELVAPILVAPLLFVYGESLPKYVFYQAPNRFLRACSPGLFLSAVLFAPITALLWLVSKFLQFVVRQSPQVIELVLARREISQILAEGHEVGILQPTQQTLAQATFSLSSRPVRDFITPLHRYVSATAGMNRQQILAIARRSQQNLIPIQESSNHQSYLGYARVDEMAVQQTETPQLHQLVELRPETSFLAALLKLLEADHSLGVVETGAGRTLGFVTARQLAETLLAAEER